MIGGSHSAHDHDPLRRNASNQARADTLILHRLHRLKGYPIDVGERVDDTAAIQQQRSDAFLGQLLPKECRIGGDKRPTRLWQEIAPDRIGRPLDQIKMAGGGVSV